MGSTLQARRVNQHSDEALELAKSVEDRAQRLETIALERRDVAWTQTYFKETHTLSSQNVGTVTAHDVVLVVDP